MVPMGEMYYSDNDGYDRPILLLETMEVIPMCLLHSYRSISHDHVLSDTTSHEVMTRRGVQLGTHELGKRMTLAVVTR